MIEKVNFEKLSGLIPVVVVESSSKKIVMLGFMNKEALEKTLETKEMYYYSRTRKKLWKKGENSGNTQKLVSLRIDCDCDSLIAEVVQKGVVCHEGKDSCFYRTIYGEKPKEKEKEDVIEELLGVIRARKITPKKESYVCKLLDGKVNVEDKIVEESRELIEAKKKEEIVWEAADLMFFILVYLEKNNIEYKEVLKELERRRR